MKKIFKWRKWSAIIPVLMSALILGLTPAAAFAEADEAAVSADSWRPARGALALVAPRAAQPGQQISMTVFLRWDQTPFAGAGIWAFTRENADALRAELNSLYTADAAAATEADYEAVAGVYGTFLGRTDGSGRLYHAFTESGTYVLAAFHSNYVPGFSTIRIGSGPVRGLTVTAPQTAEPNEPVTMYVNERNSSTPVDAAGVWAFTRENAEILSTEIAAIREAGETAPADIDYESLAAVYGFFLGTTADDGSLTASFAEEGGYMLLAVKSGYVPGRTGIRIGETVKALVLSNPNRVRVDEPVTLSVSLRGTQERVEGAAIWAVTRSNMEAMQNELQAMKENAVSAADIDYASTVRLYGFSLGTTDSTGSLTAMFSESGAYVLVAIKDGCIPAFGGIRVVGPNDTPTVRPDNTDIDEAAEQVNLRTRTLPVEITDIESTEAS